MEIIQTIDTVISDFVHLSKTVFISSFEINVFIQPSIKN